jgi:arabinofuranan 3-O-arabinosyltransferase
VHPEPSFAVVIPTYNEERNIDRLLRSLRGQVGVTYAIAVVDQGSNDRTIEIARFHKCSIVAAPVAPNYTGLARSRNLGARAVPGRVLLHLDADMELCGNDFLLRLASVLDAEHRAAIVHEIDVADGFWARCKALERSMYWGTGMEAPRAVTREVFENVGGYDEGVAAGEDFIVARRYERCTQVAQDPSLILCHHLGRYSLFAILRKKYIYGRTVRQYLRAAEAIGGKSAFSIATTAVAAYLRSWPALTKHPMEYLCIPPMRTAEFLAMQIGVCAEMISPRSMPKN